MPKTAEKDEDGILRFNLVHVLSTVTVKTKFADDPHFH